METCGGAALFGNVFLHSPGSHTQPVARFSQPVSMTAHADGRTPVMNKHVHQAGST